MDYDKQAEIFLKKTKTKMNIEYLRRAKYFTDDTRPRDIYKIRMSTPNKIDACIFEFGQSIHNTYNEVKEPTPYDILCCLPKSDPDTFEDFCLEFGYDSNLIASKKIYDTVVKEYHNVRLLYTNEEIELLCEIQ